MTVTHNYGTDYRLVSHSKDVIFLKLKDTDGDI